MVVFQDRVGSYDIELGGRADLLFARDGITWYGGLIGGATLGAIAWLSFALLLLSGLRAVVAVVMP